MNICCNYIWSHLPDFPDIGHQSGFVRSSDNWLPLYGFLRWGGRRLLVWTLLLSRLANDPIQKWNTHSAAHGWDVWALLTPCPERDLPPFCPSFGSRKKRHEVRRREQQLENTHVWCEPSTPPSPPHTGTHTLFSRLAVWASYCTNFTVRSL